MNGPVQAMSPSQLLQEFREVLLKMGDDIATGNGPNKVLDRRALELEAEIDRRMAW